MRQKINLFLLGLWRFGSGQPVPPEASTLSALWTFPSVLVASLMIAWAAEAAQFLISQGLALAILAWLQTLPEFAVEFVIAWEKRVDLMTANLTGSLRLLVGLGWPLIYATAAFFNRRKTKQPLREIVLEREHAVEVVSLGAPILYFFVILLKGALTVFDSLILMILYFGYLYILQKIPPQSEEKIEELEYVPRKIMTSSRRVRNTTIIGLFLGGGLIMYFVAEPFLHSMLLLAVSAGVSQFVFVQWVAPFLSEFPEKVSALYWARTVRNAPLALMNMVSSNINQWTMLAAMLPVVYSFRMGALTPIPFNAHQKLEIALTISQSLLGLVLLINMRFSCFEACLLFTLWFVQFVFSAVTPSESFFSVHLIVTILYFVWSAVELGRMIFGDREFTAFKIFGELAKSHLARRVEAGRK
jgi:cation:H+ antiporter